VLVLGYPSEADGATNSVQRFRVEAGVATYREHRCSKLVLSGGPTRNEYVEAESMAALAESLGVPAGELVLERSARTTWENVGCTARLAGTAEHVLVVSDSLHARRAARYACRQDPELCKRFLPAGVRPPVGWSLAAAPYELWTFVRDSMLYETGAATDAPACPGTP
jgi:uncharacterized SAM-binding protein YcdF (DUF218 family)